MRRPAFASVNSDPISTINTTPMIDIMLVLLIMLIITLPKPTHQVPIDLPTAGGNAATPVVHRLSLDANGATAWDGQPIDGSALTTRLNAMSADPAKPVLHLQTDPAAPYFRFDQTLAAVKRAGITRIGFVGNPPAF